LFLPVFLAAPPPPNQNDEINGLVDEGLGAIGERFGHEGRGP
jgi:hypothetical protein